MNDNIIPYVPIAERVQAKKQKSQILCQQFFTMIDKLVQSQLIFNHDTSIGMVSINLEHINDLSKEMYGETFDIELLERHFKRLVYPKFLGVKEINSPIWNDTITPVWQFQLNQIDKCETATIKGDDAEYLLDQVLGYIRTWKLSLETNTTNPQTTYRANDLVYTLSDLESKLNQVQEYIAHH